MKYFFCQYLQAVVLLVAFLICKYETTCPTSFIVGATIQMVKNCQLEILDDLCGKTKILTSFYTRNLLAMLYEKPSSYDRWELGRVVFNPVFFFFLRIAYYQVSRVIILLMDWTCQRFKGQNQLVYCGQRPLLSLPNKGTYNIEIEFTSSRKPCIISDCRHFSFSD